MTNLTSKSLWMSPFREYQTALTISWSILFWNFCIIPILLYAAHPHEFDVIKPVGFKCLVVHEYFVMCGWIPQVYISAINKILDVIFVCLTRFFQLNLTSIVIPMYLVVFSYAISLPLIVGGKQFVCFFLFLNSIRINFLFNLIFHFSTDHY